MSYDPLNQRQVHVPAFPSDHWEKGNMKVRSQERVLAWIALSVLGLMAVLTLVVLVR